MSHGGKVKVKFYLGIRPSVHDKTYTGINGPHVLEASAIKTWQTAPGKQDDMLVIPMELELPEEAFLPVMPTIKVSIPIESIGEVDVKVDGAVKRIDTSKKAERKLNP